MAKETRVALDAIAAFTVLLLSVWAYELGNLLVLSLTGATVSLSFNGALPAGVLAVGHLPSATLLKIFQVGAVGGLTGLATFGLARSGLPLAAHAAAMCAGATVWSLAWEMLGAFPAALAGLHYLSFCAISFTVFALVARTAGVAQVRPPGVRA